MGFLTRFRRADPLVCQEFVELVTDYLEGALAPRDRARFETHLAACEGCTAYFDSLRLTVDTLRSHPPDPPPDPETREALVQAFRDLRERKG